jgi:hypothetical protein
MFQINQSKRQHMDIFHTVSSKACCDVVPPINERETQPDQLFGSGMVDMAQYKLIEISGVNLS